MKTASLARKELAAIVAEMPGTASIANRSQGSRNRNCILRANLYGRGYVGLSAGIVLCVICAGCDTRLLIPPRLSASLNSCVNPTKAVAASTVSSFNLNDTIPPNPFDCPAAIVCPGCEASPG